jgi:N-acyl-D-amino-acid deacylase
MFAKDKYLIKNGNIIDGTGKKRFVGDVLIEGGKIKQIGKIEDSNRYKTIEAGQMVVCPGFIDVNNHSDAFWTLFKYPNQESLITQGITTIVGGNCGTSIFPIISKHSFDSMEKYIDTNQALLNWKTAKEFFKVMAKKKLAVNFLSLIGHSTLRRVITKNKIRELKEEEQKAVLREVKKALKQGAFGVSIGLSFRYSRKSTQTEILKLAEVVKEYEGILAVHLRDEGEKLIESVKEVIKIVEKTKVSLQISHFKAVNENNWPLFKKALNLINQARKNGLNINFDVYPYNYNAPVLYSLLPDWIIDSGREELLKSLKNNLIKQKVVQQMKQSGFDYSKIIISSSKIDFVLPRYSVAEIAKNQEREPEEVVLDLILSSDETITVLVEQMEEKNVQKAIQEKYSIIATNGAGYAKEHQNLGDLVHPRCFGTFPKFLREYVFQNKKLSLEEAIKKITYQPAAKYGLIEKTGTLEEGKNADILIFDPDKFKDYADTANPYVYSRGIKELIVNGRFAILNYGITQEMPGQVFKRS